MHGWREKNSSNQRVLQVHVLSIGGDDLALSKFSACRLQTLEWALNGSAQSCGARREGGDEGNHRPLRCRRDPSCQQGRKSRRVSDLHFAFSEEAPVVAPRLQSLKERGGGLLEVPGPRAYLLEADQLGFDDSPWPSRGSGGKFGH